MYQKIKKYWWLILILIVVSGFFLRLYKLTDLFHFTYDEEVFAFVGKRMFINGHIPLIGGVTPMHVHVAPYFYWFSGVILFLSKLNPLGWGIAAAFIYLSTILVLFIFGKIIFNKKVGFIAVIIYAFSFYQNIFDRHYWGLLFDGLVSLLVILSLFQLIKNKNKYIYLLAIVLSFAFHTDWSTLPLFILTILIFIIYKIRVSKKQIFLAISIFLISFLPLVFFDLRHNFSNSSGLLQYVKEIQAGRKGKVNKSNLDILLYIPKTLIRTLYPYGNKNLTANYAYCSKDVLNKYNAVPNILAVTLLLFIVLSFLYKPKNQSEKDGLKLIKILFFSTYFGIGLYGIVFKGDLFDHYLSFLFPLFYLYLSYFIFILIKNNKTIFGILIIFITINTYFVINAKHIYGYANKTEMIKWTIATIGNNDFSLDVLSDCFRYNGYRYLYYLYGHEPAKSYVDANFTHLYDQTPAFKHPKYLVMIVNPDYINSQTNIDKYKKFKEKQIISSKFEEVEAIIIDNSNLDFVGEF